jgi:hypothetical protein
MFLFHGGGEFSYHLAEEISLLTGQSWLQVDTVVYDKSASKVTFTIERFPLTSVKRRLLGTFDAPLYNRTRRIRTLVEIKSVISCEITNRLDKGQREFQILLGIVIKGGALTVTSVNEDRGEILYDMRVVVDALDVVLKDQRDVTPS